MPPNERTPPRDPRTLSLRWFRDVWNARREATIDELCSDDFEAHLTGIREPVDKEGFRRHFRALVGAVPDLHVEILETSMENETVVLAWQLTGHHTGSGLGIPPSGRHVSFAGLTWLDWRDGRLIGVQDRWNRGEVLARLAEPRVEEVEADHGLTPRQAEVALLMAERRTHKEIARALGIRPNTARRHWAMVMRKLGVHRREDVAQVLGNGRGE